ncbi:sugar ABC transporter permease [bacterium]|nr:MAG: sugar ABC transporter permease [bacterium]
MRVRWYTPYLFILPSIIAMIVLVYTPLFIGIGYSFTNISQKNSANIEYKIPQRESDGTISYKYEPKPNDLKFTGLQNYTETISTPTFWQVLWQTLVWTFFNVLFHFVIGLGLALLINKPIKGRNFYRMMLMVPWAVPSYISAFSWRWLFNADYGFFNQILTGMGIAPISWLSDPNWAMFAVIATNIWLGFPFMMVTLLGGLQNIPEELYEAATVDGATKWQQFRNVTMPLLMPVALTTTLLGAIWTFNMFNIIYLVTQDNPHTDILATFSFKAFFVRGEYALASSYSVIILLLLAAFSVFYLRILKKSESIY